MSTDLNLLFGVLALNAGFIDRDAFIAACTVWASDKTRPLAEVLTQLGKLEAKDRDLVQALVQHHLDKHGGDAPKSLAAQLDPSAHSALAAVPDPEVHHSIARAETTLLQAPFPIRLDPPGPAAEAERTEAGPRIPALASSPPIDDGQSVSLTGRYNCGTSTGEALRIWSYTG